MHNSRSSRHFWLIQERVYKRLVKMLAPKLGPHIQDARIASGYWLWKYFWSSLNHFFENKFIFSLSIQTGSFRYEWKSIEIVFKNDNRRHLKKAHTGWGTSLDTIECALFLKTGKGVREHEHCTCQFNVREREREINCTLLNWISQAVQDWILAVTSWKMQWPKTDSLL